MEINLKGIIKSLPSEWPEFKNAKKAVPQRVFWAEDREEVPAVDADAPESQEKIGVLIEAKLGEMIERLERKAANAGPRRKMTAAVFDSSSSGKIYFTYQDCPALFAHCTADEKTSGNQLQQLLLF